MNTRARECENALFQWARLVEAGRRIETIFSFTPESRIIMALAEKRIVADFDTFYMSREDAARFLRSALGDLIRRHAEELRKTIIARFDCAPEDFNAAYAAFESGRSRPDGDLPGNGDDEPAVDGGHRKDLRHDNGEVPVPSGCHLEDEDA